jgi:hypothetical protein
MGTTEYYMKAPCKECPFRVDVYPYLTPERGEELASSATNKYNSFPCHKTTENIDIEDGFGRTVTQNSKVCAGFLTLQYNETGCSLPDGFTPSNLIYSDSFEMIQVYENPEEYGPS